MELGHVHIGTEVEERQIVVLEELVMMPAVPVVDVEVLSHAVAQGYRMLIYGKDLAYIPWVWQHAVARETDWISSKEASVMTLLPVAVCLVGFVGLLAAEKVGSLKGKWLFKPIAAAAYVWAALAWGALESTYGRWLLLGLVLCWWGDVQLIPRQRRSWFRAGIVAFLAGHLAYITAFISLPTGLVGLVVGNLMSGILAWVVWTWLGPKLAADYRRLVAVYLLVICAMLVTAFTAADGAGRWTIALGATLFALSDVSVARDRFVTKAFVNRAWGLPLYFAAQLILASTVAL